MPRRDLGDWSPIYLGGILAWIAADDPRMTLTNNASIDFWPDQSVGGKNSIGLETGTGRPTWVASAQGSKPAFSFSYPSFQKISNAVPTDGILWCMAVFNFTKGAAFDSTTSNLIDEYISSGGAAMIQGLASTTTLNNTNIMYVNNVVAAGHPDITPLSTTRIVYHQRSAAVAYNSGLNMGRTGTGGFSWGGTMSEMLIGKTALTTHERTLLFAYLNEKYGVY